MTTFWHPSAAMAEVDGHELTLGGTHGIGPSESLRTKRAVDEIVSVPDQDAQAAAA